MESMIKLVSINIEKDRHLNSVADFIKAEDPDVICLQEAFLMDWVELAREGNYYLSSAFTHLTKRLDGSLCQEGEVIMTKQVPSGGGFIFYHLADSRLAAQSSQKD